MSSSSFGWSASDFRGTSLPLIRRRGGLMGFRWRSDASLLAMKRRNSASFTGFEHYNESRIRTLGSGPRRGLAGPPPKPFAGFSSRPHATREGFDANRLEQTADPRARGDAEPVEQVLSADVQDRSPAGDRARESGGGGSETGVARA